MVLKLGKLQKVYQKYLESFEMWCWRMMDRISWTNHVKITNYLHIIKKQKKILHTIKRWMANWIDHILGRNCLRKHVTKGKIGQT